MGLAPEQCGGEAMFANETQGLGDIVADAREAFEIAVDDRLALGLVDPEPAREAPGRDPVENREVDRLGLVAGVAVDASEQFLRGHAVNIGARRERLLELGDVRDVRGEAKLDLAVVGAHQQMARFGDEGVADLPAQFGPDGDVLKIGIGRGQPTGLRRSEAITGVDPSGGGVDLRLERVGVGGLELGQLTPFEHQPGAGHALGGKPFEFVDVGRIGPALALAPALETEPVVKHLAELLGRADRERAAGRFEHPLLEPRNLGREGLRQGGKMLAVDLDALALHRRDDRDQRPVDEFIDSGRIFRRNPGLEPVPQAERDVGVLGGIFGRLGECDLVESQLVLAGSADRFEGQAVVGEMLFRKLVHAVAEAPGVEVEAHHHRIVDRRGRDGFLGEHGQVIFEIVTDLEHRRVLEQRLQTGHDFGLGELFGGFGEHVDARMADRDVAGASRSGREADPGEAGDHTVDAVGFGIDRDEALRGRLGDPAVERVDRHHRLVGRAVDDYRLGLSGAKAFRLEPDCGTAAALASSRRGRAAADHPVHQGLEPHVLEENAKGLGRDAFESERFQGLGKLAVAHQPNQLTAQAGVGGVVNQRLSELGLGDLVGRGEDGLQVSELLDEQGRGLRADPGDSGDIVDAVAHQREDIADLFGWHSELFDHLVDPDPAVVHRVEHVDVAVDQLHQILVRADDGHLPAGELGGGAIAGDDVVGLEPGLLDARDRKGASGGSDEWKLGDQILGRRRPVGLVLVVHLIAEGRCRGIENDPSASFHSIAV